MAQPQLSAKAQASLELPEGFKSFSPFPFTGLNTSGTPLAIADTEFTWIENFVHIGDGKLRTIWDAGDPIYAAPNPQTIVYEYFFTIGTTYYVMVFLSGGTAVQKQLDNGAITFISNPLPFYVAATGYVPAARQWGTQYLLISNRNTPNDYWAWDGSLLYFAGSAAPNGVNLLSGGFAYSSLPDIQVYGGSGSGIGLNAVISGGQIVEL